MAFDYKKYGKKLKDHRKALNYSQKDVYKMTGISIETQRLLENGHREPRLVTLERLSELYKADLIHELIHTRTINDVQNLINTFDYDGFIKRIEELIESIKKEYLNDTHYID